MEDTRAFLLEVQVSAHSIHVTGRGLAQAAVDGWLGLLQTLHSISHIASMAHTASRVRASAQAVSMLAAAATVAVFAGVAGPAAPAITLIVWQAGAVDRCAYLAAVGMLTTTTTPILAQVGHCACAAVPFIAQAALAAVARAAHCLGCTGWGTRRLQLQLRLTARPRPALIAEAGARAPKALITVAMRSAAAGLAMRPKGPRGTEFTCCSSKP